MISANFFIGRVTSRGRFSDLKKKSSIPAKAAAHFNEAFETMVIAWLRYYMRRQIRNADLLKSYYPYLHIFKLPTLDIIMIKFTENVKP